MGAELKILLKAWQEMKEAELRGGKPAELRGGKPEAVSKDLEQETPEAKEEMEEKDEQAEEKQDLVAVPKGPEPLVAVPKEEEEVERVFSGEKMSYDEWKLRWSLDDWWNDFSSSSYTPSSSSSSSSSGQCKYSSICGKPDSGYRIINGESVDIKKRPWQVGLFITKTKEERRA